MLKLEIYSWLIIFGLLVSCSDENLNSPDNITKTIKLLTPNGGEDFIVGDTINITWESLNISTLKISYSIDGGINWGSVIDSVPALDNNILWIIPNSITTKGLIEIKAIEDTSIKDISNTFFKINPDSSILRIINLLYPNGGEEFYVGDTININWVSPNISFVKISYSIDGGLNWTDIGNPINAQNNNISWVVPNSVTTKGFIEIKDVDDPSIVDRSNNFFNIINNPIIENLKFYPLHIGDEWRYFTTQWNYWTDSTTIIDSSIAKVISDTTMPNGHTYFIHKIIRKNGSSFTKYVRLDSVTAQVFVYNFSTSGEQESWPFSLSSGSYWNGYSILEDTYTIQYLNYTDRMKSFEHRANTYISKFYFVKGIGEAHSFGDDRMGRQNNTYLYYAKINGVEYGDTLSN